LWAPLEDVVRLSEEGFMLAADSTKLPMGHTSKFVLVDQNGMIRGYYSGLDKASIKVLKESIRHLAKELP
jgi:hypothetical protein